MSNIAPIGPRENEIIDPNDWQRIAEVGAYFVERGKRIGACCPHSANNHVWLIRGGELYSTACNKCECNYWKEDNATTDTK